MNGVTTWSIQWENLEDKTESIISVCQKKMQAKKGNIQEIKNWKNSLRKETKRLKGLSIAGSILQITFNEESTEWLAVFILNVFQGEKRLAEHKKRVIAGVHVRV